MSTLHCKRLHWLTSSTPGYRGSGAGGVETRQPATAACCAASLTSATLTVLPTPPFHMPCSRWLLRQRRFSNGRPATVRPPRIAPCARAASHTVSARVAAAVGGAASTATPAGRLVAKRGWPSTPPRHCLMAASSRGGSAPSATRADSPGGRVRTPAAPRARQRGAA